MTGKAVREMVGLSAVVASLAFVGFEVRQNTAAVESAAFQALSELQIQITLEMATDPGMPPLIVRLREGALPEDFTPEEDQRLRIWYFAYIRVVEAAYRQVGVGAVGDDTYSALWTGLLVQDYLPAAWPSMRYNLDPTFADFFEELLPEMRRSREAAR